ncbi:MAG: hypothetical protein ABR499_19165 [Gemmatimonadaceae bacterium]
MFRLRCFAARYVALLLVLGAGACGSQPTPTGPRLIGEGRRILFVGNSLTYVNDLPGIVQALADSARGDRLAVETVAGPNFALVDHWNEGTARREIALGGWELVVLQQGPSSVEANRDSLRLFTGRFATEIASVNARPALYSVWPTAARQQDFARAIESYTLAASDVNGVLFPVASAWLAAWERDANIRLYGPDGFHPSLTGSYLAALVMYAKILNRSPVGLPSRLRIHSGAVITIDPETARMLQEVAAAVVGL